MIDVGDRVERVEQLPGLPNVGVIVNTFPASRLVAEQASLLAIINAKLLFTVRWSNGKEVMGYETDFRKITDEEYVALVLRGDEWK